MTIVILSIYYRIRD